MYMYVHTHLSWWESFTITKPNFKTFQTGKSHISEWVLRDSSLSFPKTDKTMEGLDFSYLFFFSITSWRNMAKTTLQIMYWIIKEKYQGTGEEVQSVASCQSTSMSGRINKGNLVKNNEQPEAIKNSFNKVLICICSSCCIWFQLMLDWDSQVVAVTNKAHRTVTCTRSGT